MDCRSVICLLSLSPDTRGGNGEISSFKQFVSYSTAAFDQVKEDISISNTLLDVESCGPAMLKVTVLQQTVTVQDEGLLG